MSSTISKIAVSDVKSKADVQISEYALSIMTLIFQPAKPLSRVGETLS